MEQFLSYNKSDFIKSIKEDPSSMLIPTLRFGAVIYLIAIIVGIAIGVIALMISIL